MHKEPVLFLLFMTARRVKTRRVKARMETDPSPTAVFAPWMLIYNNHSSPRRRPPARPKQPKMRPLFHEFVDLFSTFLRPLVVVYYIPNQLPKRRVRGAGHTNKYYPNRNVQEVHLLLLIRKITSLIQLIFGLFS